ncbi:MAG: DNA polymerase I [Bacteroidales bacterium]
MSTSNRLFLLDAYALIYRSYYAFIKNPRVNSKGENTSAIFGFINTLEDLLKRESPTHLAVAFDPPGPTFRHTAFEAYKAQREKTPETIIWSIPYIKDILRAYQIPILEVEGFEADDVIGTLSLKAEKEGFEVYMMTPDKDFGQLVSERSFIYRPRYGSSEFEVMGIDEVNKKFGLEHPCQIIDLLSLMGDASDNIPGCPGIGIVTAQKLIAEFGDVDTLLNNTEKLKGSVKQKIENNREQIIFSRFLATIKRDVPIEFVEEELRMVPRDENKIMSIFEQLEFRALMKKISASNSYALPKTKSSNTQLGEKNNFKPIFVAASQPGAGKKNPAGEHLQTSLWDEQGNTTAASSPSFPKDKTRQNAGNDLFSDNLKAINQDDSSDHLPETTLKSLKTEPHSYHVLDNEGAIQNFIDEFSDTDFFAFSTQTDNKDILNAHLLGIAFAKEKNKAYYLPCPQNQKNCQELLNSFKPLFENESSLKIGYELKNEILVLHNYDLPLRGPLFDILIAHYLIQPELRHKLDFLAKNYLNYQGLTEESILGPKGKNQKSLENLSIDVLSEYASEQADLCLQLKSVLEAEIKKEGIDNLYHEIEAPLIYVLADMENSGVYIDTEALKSSSVLLTEKMNGIEQEIYELAGKGFNINSAKQVGEVLFEHLHIVDKAKRTKTGQFSTSEEVLENLRSKHPIVGKILDHRGLKKLLSTYIDALPLLINPKTGKIHTTFNQAVTSTGRLSSSNPNLQNIPIRDEQGKEIRKVFSAGSGELFLSADYSQIELRIMAHLSEDENMIEAFRLNQDIHAATAAKIFKLPIEEVSQDMRRKAKTANFGIIYGISTFGLAERMGVSRTEAKELIEGYFETYPKIKAYMDYSIQMARDNYWVETVFHRKRYLPDIQSRNAVVRSYAERNAINAPIQGTAADLIKIAMVRIFKALEAAQLKTKMILQVHDELNFIVPEQELEQVKKLVMREMENAAQFKVPLKAEIGVGKNWLEAH